MRAMKYCLRYFELFEHSVEIVFKDEKVIRCNTGLTKHQLGA
jgi:hypothetical protein